MKCTKKIFQSEVRFLATAASNQQAAITASINQKNLTMKNQLKLIAALVLAAGSLNIQTHAFGTEATRVTYHTTKIDGLNLFYREAGDPARPTIVLLHGFPSSSHMFRNLIPKLAVKYHVIAPDYPGYGYSDQPAAADFAKK